MCQWHRNIQRMIDEIDACIRREDDEAVALHRLAARLGEGAGGGASTGGSWGIRRVTYPENSEAFPA